MHNLITHEDRAAALIPLPMDVAYEVYVIGADSKVLAVHGPVIGGWPMRELADRLADENPDCTIVMRRVRLDIPAPHTAYAPGRQTLGGH